MTFEFEGVEPTRIPQTDPTVAETPPEMSTLAGKPRRDESRSDLRAASDEEIGDAIQYADPLVLRGLLYQLTGDETLKAMRVTTDRSSVEDVSVLAEPCDVAVIMAKASEFLTTHRDRGAEKIEVGPASRLPGSLALAAGAKQLPTEDLELWIEELALNPWARGIEWGDVPTPNRLQRYTVLVIGAGMGGLNAAVHLKHAGIPFTVLEKNAGVGGTWFENRYPGARVDSPSRCYTHIFGVEYIAPYEFCPAAENRKYFDWVADTFDVRRNIVFDTEVVAAVWNQASDEWNVTAVGPEGTRVWNASVVITAVGFLSRPNVPEIAGMSDFHGASFHTARWPEAFDVKNRRIAVVGTGCTGYQLVPELALEADRVYVFQRTPQWLFDVPGYRSPQPPEVTWLDRSFPYLVNFMRFKMNWLARPENATLMFDIDPEFVDAHARSAFNKQIRSERIEFLRAKLGGRPDLIDRMIPQHPPFSARIVLVDREYSVLDALLRDNVTLVSDPIREITRRGLATASGHEYEVDAIVYATGFKANDFLWPMEIRGRGGRRVDELWATDGPRAYLGAMLPGFPNLFLLYGPNTNPFGGGLGVVNHEEMITRFALLCMQELVETGNKRVEVSEDAYSTYNKKLDAWDAVKIYRDPRAHSYYCSKYGRSATNCPFPATDMWRWLRRPDFAEINLR